MYILEHGKLAVYIDENADWMCYDVPLILCPTVLAFAMAVPWRSPGSSAILCQKP